MERKEVLDVALNALERLLKMFTVERYVYLTLTAVSFLLLLLVSWQYFTGPKPDRALFELMFGSAGLIAASAARITWFFNRSFSLIEGIVKTLTK